MANTDDKGGARAPAVVSDGLAGGAFRARVGTSEFAVGGQSGTDPYELLSVSDVSTIEADVRFSGREDFWIIAAARSEDETEIRAGKAAGGRRDQGHSARDPSTLFS